MRNLEWYHAIGKSWKLRFQLLNINLSASFWRMWCLYELQRPQEILSSIFHPTFDHGCVENTCSSSYRMDSQHLLVSCQLHIFVQFWNLDGAWTWQGVCSCNSLVYSCLNTWFILLLSVNREFTCLNLWSSQSFSISLDSLLNHWFSYVICFVVKLYLIHLLLSIFLLYLSYFLNKFI